MSALGILLGVVLSAFGSSENQYNSYNPDTYDVCQVQYTMQHFQQGRCVEIERPIKAGSTETFRLRSVVLSEKSDSANTYPTLIVIPGGPGQSSGLFRYALNDKDILNALLTHLKLNVVLYDPRGTGTSQLQAPPQSYDLAVFNQENMVDDVAALADAVSPSQPVFLLAHSAGGATALRFAQKYPQRVAKIALVSTSISPRHMSEMNMKIYEMAPLLWQSYWAQTPVLPADLNEKYLYIEDVAVQQLKARVLKQYVHQDIKRMPLDLRAELLLAINSDTKGAAVATLINAIYDEFKLIEATSGQKLVPDELRILKIVDDYSAGAEKFVGGEWIKVAISCGEGMRPEELSHPSFFDGLPMSWYCNGFSTAAPVDIDLTTISTPIVFFAGVKDTLVPPTEARGIDSGLPDAKLIVSEKAGHNMFSEDAPKFFFGLEKFLQ